MANGLVAYNVVYVGHPPMGYLHNLTDISENCVVQHLQVSCNTIFTDRINPIFCRTTQSVRLCK
jgi:hypothetical protein